MKTLQSEQLAQKCLEVLVERLPLGIAVVDWNLRVRLHNAVARELCDKRPSGKNTRGLKRQSDFQLPFELLEKCEEFKRECETRTRTTSPRRGQITRHFTLPTLRASVTLVPVSYPAKPVFLLKLEKLLRGAKSADIFLQLEKLNRSEREIVELIREGKSNQEIADELHRAVGTIKGELYSIFQKLGVSSRSKLMVLFQRVEPGR